MAIYHYSASVVSRGKGQSAINTLSYIEKQQERDERLEKTFDYSRKQDEVKFRETALPEGAKERYKSAGNLWNDIEKSEKRADAQLAQRINIALPKEMTLEQQIQLGKAWALSQTRQGYAVSWAIHDRGDGNAHIDAMRTIRKWDEQKGKWGNKSHFEYELDKDGNRILNPKRGKNQYKYLGKKISNIGRDDLKRQRKIWADLANEHLARAGHDVRIDERTLKAQRSDEQKEAAAAMKRGDLDGYERHARAAADLSRTPKVHEFNLQGGRNLELVAQNQEAARRDAPIIARKKAAVKKKKRDAYWKKQAQARKRGKDAAARLAIATTRDGAELLADAPAAEELERQAAITATPPTEPQERRHDAQKEQSTARPASSSTTAGRATETPAPAKQPLGFSSLFSEKERGYGAKQYDVMIFANQEEAASFLGITTTDLARKSAIQNVRATEKRLGRRVAAKATDRDKILRSGKKFFEKGKGPVLVCKTHDDKQPKTGARTAADSVGAVVKCLDATKQVLDTLHDITGAIPIVGKPLQAVVKVAKSPIDIADKIGQKVEKVADKIASKGESKEAQAPKLAPRSSGGGGGGGGQARVRSNHADHGGGDGIVALNGRMDRDDEWDQDLKWLSPMERDRILAERDRANSI